MNGPTESKFRFAFLNNEAHPMGRLMLERLCTAGFVPQALVEERSSFAERKTAAYVRGLNAEEMPSSSGDIARRFDIPIFTVGNINATECEDVLQRYRVTMVILGNTRIITPHMLAQIPRGYINVHPGLLPRIRGAFPQCWSILHDEPIGSSCHFVDEGVDTGPIISRKEVAVFVGDTLERIVCRTMFAGADLLLEAMPGLSRMEVPSIAQAAEDGTTFHWPPPEAIWAARERLARREYRYLTLR